MSAENHKVIFISYSRHDSLDFARKLSKSLQKEGYIVFLDVEDIIGGDNWQNSLREALEDATHLVAILTPQSVNSEWCNMEWDVARQLSLPIVPVLYLDCKIDVFMSRLQYIDFRNKADYDTKCKELGRAIEKHGTPDDHPLHHWRHLPVMNFAPPPEKVRCIPANTSVSEAHNIIVKKVKYAFRHLIVTDTGKNRGKLQGVVGLRNLIEDISDPDSDIANTPVSKLMVKFDPEPKDEPNCIWLDENATVADALKTFDQRVTRDDAAGYYFYLSAIPIIEANNKFHSLSIISFKDILNAMLNGIIPIPKLTIEKMGYLKDVVTSDIHGDPFAMKSKMNVAGKGQRDLPIMNTEDKSLLLGLVPDHKLITNYYTGRKVGDVDVMAKLQFLRLQTPETLLEDMLKEYVSSDQSKIFYSFPVVSSKENPEFLGLVGYRDIFKALLKL